MVLDLAPGEDLAKVKARLAALHQAYRTEYASYYKTHAKKDSPAMRGADPAIVLIPGIGMFSFGANKQTARVAGEFYLNAINVMRGAEALSTYSPISDAEKFNIEYWALEEAKLSYPLEKIQKDAKTGEHLAANPMGAVPTLLLDNGQSLTECAAILQWVADQKPELALAPKAGTWERYKFAETLNFIATEIHKNFGPLFGASRYSFDDENKAKFLKVASDNLNKRLELLDKRLEKNSFLMGGTYSVADAYLFVTLGWAYTLKFPIEQYTHLSGFKNRVFERPAVQSAMKNEGLLK
jgi:glutathione S-transferase